MFPDCIYVNFWKALVMNVVNLSGPGAKILFERGKWFEILENFWLSFMTIAETKEERLKEFQDFIDLLKKYLPFFRARIGLKVNITCPNTAHNLKEIEDEVMHFLEIAARLGIPIGIKVNIFTSTKTVKRIFNAGLCDAVFVSNTIRWGEISERINWEKLFGRKVSPLKKYGDNAGAMSGWPALPLVKEWVSEARGIGIDGIIIGGNGISRKEHIDLLFPLVDGFSIGSAGMVRPHRLQGLINYADQKITERNGRN